MAFEEQQPFDPASFEHIPVLLNECLTGLAIDPAFICRVRYRFRKGEFCVRYQQDKRSWNNNQCSCY